jgi:hypothetical protein
MHADANDIPGRDRRRIDYFDRFVHEDRVAHTLRRRRRQNEEPSRSNHRRSKGVVTGIDEMNAHERGAPSFISPQNFAKAEVVAEPAKVVREHEVGAA